MKKLVTIIAILFAGYASAQTKSGRFVQADYVPASHKLYQTIVKMDSLYFDTYNNCNLAKMDSLTAEDIEFYHDRELYPLPEALRERLETAIMEKCKKC